MMTTSHSNLSSRLAVLKANLAVEQLTDYEKQGYFHFCNDPARDRVDRNLLLALWKWRLLHPLGITNKDFTLLTTSLSGVYVLGTFPKMPLLDVDVFIHFYKYDSLRMLSIVAQMLYGMHMQLPDFMIAELLTFMRSTLGESKWVMAV